MVAQACFEGSDKQVSETLNPDRSSVSAFGMSDVGRVRKNNEDNFVIFNLSTGENFSSLHPDSHSALSHPLGPLGTLFLVADGMGGESSGEVASSICASIVPGRLYENLKSAATVTLAHFASSLREAIEYANRSIFEKAQNDEDFRGMGTTATAAALLGSWLVVAQVGDSRAYLCRNAELVQLTHDQTFLNYLLEMGAEFPGNVEHDNRKSILTQAVGTSATVDVKVIYTDLHAADRILLCSDGLYNMVRKEDIAQIISGHAALAEKCRALVEMAGQGGRCGQRHGRDGGSYGRRPASERPRHQAGTEGVSRRNFNSSW
jgi:PPM family protein phosphatase